MKERPIQQKTAPQNPNKSGHLFQDKTENRSFFQGERAEGSFFSPATEPTPVQLKKNENLPEDLQTNMEHSLGHDFSNVNIQKDSQEAADMHARAFTKGDSVHFARGEFDPHSEQGKNLIGHEFTHVAQQRSGAVQPTRIMGKGLQLNDNQGLEHEADHFGRKAAKGDPVSKYRSSGLGMRNSMRVAQAKSDVVQRSIDTFGGKWDTDQYDLKKDEVNGIKYPVADGYRGVDIKLKFSPGKTADAEVIGLTQSVQAFVRGAPSFTNATNEAMSIPAKDAKGINTGKGETNEGTAIDRAPAYNNPIYAVDSQPSAALDDASVYAGWGQHGYRKKNNAGKFISKDATLIDTPRRWKAAKNSRHIFEATALAVKGAQVGTYYGSVRWGWRTDSTGKFTKIPLQVVSQGVPSATFMSAAKLWNNSKDSTGANTVDLPVQWTGTIHNTPLAALRSGKGASTPTLADLPRGTKITVLNDKSGWHQVQLDSTQAGIVLNQKGRSAVMTGNLIRGYISKELINKDVSYR